MDSQNKGIVLSLILIISMYAVTPTVAASYDITVSVHKFYNYDEWDGPGKTQEFAVGLKCRMLGGGWTGWKTSKASTSMWKIVGTGEWTSSSTDQQGDAWSEDYVKRYVCRQYAGVDIGIQLFELDGVTYTAKHEVTTATYIDVGDVPFGSCLYQPMGNNPSADSRQDVQLKVCFN